MKSKSVMTQKLIVEIEKDVLKNIEKSLKEIMSMESRGRKINYK